MVAVVVAAAVAGRWRCIARAREQVDGLLGQRRLYNGTFDCAAQVFCVPPALCHPTKNCADTSLECAQKVSQTHIKAPVWL